MRSASAMCRWPQEPVNVCHQLTILDRSTCDRVMANVCRLWSAVCGINLVPSGNPSSANILITSNEDIDPSGNILGLTYLPCGMVSQASQLSEQLNPREGWTEDLLLRVMLHETGHGIGLVHVPIGTGAVMEPDLTSLSTPQDSDVQAVVARYGPPTAPTPIPVPTTPSAGGDVFGGGVLVNIQKAGTYLFKIEMVER